MSKITQSARGKECKIRLFPYCNQDPETTVFCHAPSAHKGMGVKSPDWWGTYGCSVCHDIVDRRIRVDLTDYEIDKNFFRAVFEFQAEAHEEGLIVIP